MTEVARGVAGVSSRDESLVQRAFYAVCRAIARAVVVFYFGGRAKGKENVPPEGPVLIAGNHQSYLDPPLAAVFQDRHCQFIARSGLFTFRPFARLISSLNAIPLREDAGDLGAIKEVLRLLARGRVVVIFPEGSRSPDGEVHEFKRGVALLIKRARCPVVPMAVDGAFEAWPRGRKPHLFARHRIRVAFGPPISHEEFMVGGEEAGLERLRATIISMRDALRNDRG